VAWLQLDGTRYNIYSNYFDASSGSWSTAALIESSDAGNAYAPQIAIDGAGNAIAVWQQSDGTRFNIYSNRFDASSGSWSTAALVESSDAGDAYEPQIVINGAGNAMAVWYQSDGTRDSIYSNRFE